MREHGTAVSVQVHIASVKRQGSKVVQPYALSALLVQLRGKRVPVFITTEKTDTMVKREDKGLLYCPCAKKAHARTMGIPPRTAGPLRPTF